MDGCMHAWTHARTYVHVYTYVCMSSTYMYIKIEDFSKIFFHCIVASKPDYTLVRFKPVTSYVLIPCTIDVDSGGSPSRPPIIKMGGKPPFFAPLISRRELFFYLKKHERKQKQRQRKTNTKKKGVNFE